MVLKCYFTINILIFYSFRFILSLSDREKIMTDGNLSNIWCKFVLTESIIPTAVARNLKKDDSLMQNTKLLAQILKERENFNDSQYEDIKEIVAKAFQSDEELCNWLEKIEDILTVIINFADADENKVYILNGAFISFIKSCPLVSNQVATAYLEDLKKNPFTPPLKVVSRDDFVSAVRQKHFIAYLEKKYPSKGTINSYKSAINVTSEILNKNLWLIENHEEFQKVMDYLTKDSPDATPKDQEIRLAFNNKNHHNTISCGLQQYKNYLLSIAKK